MSPDDEVRMRGIPEGVDPVEAVLDLPAVLRAYHVPEEDIRQAEATDTVELLALERVVEGAGPRYDLDQVAAESGIDAHRILLLWRALGFPEPRPGEKVFSDLDLEMLADTVPFIAEGGLDLELALQMTRVIGSSVARIATAQVDAIASALDQRRAAEERAEGDADDELDDEALDDDGAERDRRVDRQAARDEAEVALEHVASRGEVAQQSARLLPMMPKVMEFVWRRHLANAARRKMLRTTDEGATICVGFADLVGFTAQTQQLEERELAEVVGRFETASHDVVHSLGGRVIKMIGDEVMFAADDVPTGVQIALAIAEVYRNDEAFSDVRVGVAAGHVLERDGDLFGPVVNLANRIVSVAFPGAVVVSQEVVDGIEDAGLDVVLKSIRSHYLKDIGKVALWTVRRTDAAEPEGRYRRAQQRRIARRQFLVARRLQRQRGAAALSEGLPVDLPVDLSDEAFLDEPTEQFQAITEAVLDADIETDVQAELLADIDAARRLEALEREALARAEEADEEAERKVLEAEQEARRRVIEAEREARRRVEEAERDARRKIEAALAEAEAKAARANEEASRKVKQVARHAERRADQAERDARRSAKRKAERARTRRRTGEAKASARARAEEVTEDVLEVLDGVADKAKGAADAARSVLGGDDEAPDGPAPDEG